MKKLLNSFFIFALALNLLFISSAIPVHGQDEDPTEENCDYNGDGVVDEAEEAKCGAKGQPDDDPGKCDRENPGNGDECSDEGAPAEDPADEPAEDPADEPADEPGETPAETPTEDPADEPTDDQTDEPADDDLVGMPTEADDTTNDDVVEEAATIEDKTGEGGVNVDTPAVIESQEGDIGDAAVAGTWTTTAVFFQNLAAQPVSGGLNLYQQAAGGAPSTTTPAPVPVVIPQVPVDGSVTVNLSGISNGSYAGIVQADGNLGVVARQTNTVGQVEDLHIGFDASTLAQELFISRIFNEHFGYTTKLNVQNAHSSAQNITVELYKIGDATPTAAHTYNGVASNTSFTIDINTDPNFSSYPTGNDVSLGYAKVIGADGIVAAVADSVRSTGETWRNVQVSLPGLPATTSASFGDTLVVPRAFNIWFTWDTGVPVVNLTGSPTNIELVYTTDASLGGNIYKITKNAVANGGVSFFLPTDFPQAIPSFGGATVKCTTPGCEILAVSNNVYKGSTAQPSGAFNSPALNSNLGTNAAAVPLAYREGSGFTFEQDTTGVTVFNVTAGNVTTNWVKANQTPAGNTVTWTLNNQAAGTVTTFFSLDNAALNNFGPGSVFVESTGTIVVGTTHNFGNTRGGYPAIQYTK